MSEAAWDYLIVTASNETQGNAYESQLARLRRTPLLNAFRRVMVVTDLEGRRIGSGGSTLLCLMRVLDQELSALSLDSRAEGAIDQVLRRLRIMIIHAGGDSRRLPAYSPCGKIFIPVPGREDSGTASTLFERILPTFRALPPGRPGTGQVLVTSGDVLLHFDSSQVRLDLPGLVALGAADTPEHAAKHGVFVAHDHTVLRYLQKPRLDEQHAAGAVSPHGHSILDIGVMSFDTEAVLKMMVAFEIGPGNHGRLDWSAATHVRIMTHGLDLYREVCCALGSATTRKHYLDGVRASGSKWEEEALDQTFEILHPIPFHLQTVPHCTFLHFGTTRQLISSGLHLMELDRGHPPASTVVVLNSSIGHGGTLQGVNAWVEGCDVGATLTLSGQNVVTGAAIRQNLTLPPGACLDLVPGRNRDGAPVFFLRCYHIGDTFKDSAIAGGTYCGRPLLHWMGTVGARPEEIWGPDEPVDKRGLWEARVFPTVSDPGAFYDWLWLFNVEQATPEQKTAFRAADRYSASEVALRTHQAAFHARRRELQGDNPSCDTH
ncbi:MAG: L-fucokinase [bacterium]